MIYYCWIILFLIIQCKLFTSNNVILGEIARGGWGLCHPEANHWLNLDECWSQTAKKAIICGKNDMTRDDI
jgi:hypothetical protein